MVSQPDKTIILYSDNQLAAYRVFWVLKWAGVKDVRVLNGNLSTWMDANLPTETTVNTPKPDPILVSLSQQSSSILKHQKRLSMHNNMD